MPSPLTRFLKIFFVSRHINPVLSQRAYKAYITTSFHSGPMACCVGFISGDAWKYVADIPMMFFKTFGSRDFHYLIN